MKLRHAIVVLFVAITVFVSNTSFADNSSAFDGVWSGTISDLNFKLTISNSGSDAIIKYADRSPERLFFLGWKDSHNMLYLFRPADVACICVYNEGGRMRLAYFEKNGVREAMLVKL